MKTRIFYDETEVNYRERERIICTRSRWFRREEFRELKRLQNAELLLSLLVCLCYFDWGVGAKHLPLALMFSIWLIHDGFQLQFEFLFILFLCVCVCQSVLVFMFRIHVACVLYKAVTVSCCLIWFDLIWYRLVCVT